MGINFKPTKRELLLCVDKNNDAIKRQALKIADLESGLKKALSKIEEISVSLTTATAAKKLGQEVFEGEKSNWVWAATDEDGRTCLFESKPYMTGGGVWTTGMGCREVFKNYSAFDWDMSLIFRELDSPRGSDLCRHTLNKGSDGVVCLVSDYSDEKAFSEFQTLRKITSVRDSFFVTDEGVSWKFAVPVTVTEVAF